MNRFHLLKEMLEKDPHDPFLHYALAIELISQNELDAAVVQLNYLKINYANYLATYYQLGKCYEKKGMINEAVLAYQFGLKLAQEQKEDKTLREIKEALALLQDFN